MPGPTLGACSHFHAREVCTSCRLGDSHSLAPSWHRVVVCGEQRLLMPALVTGLKAWHIRPSSTFYPKRNYEAVRSAIPRGSQVVMLFCEIDCREGILVAVERCRYKDLAEGIRVVVGIYMDQLRILRDEYQLQVRCACFPPCAITPAKCAHALMRWPALLMDWLWQLFVHPIVPILNETRTISPEMASYHASRGTSVTSSESTKQ